MITITPFKGIICEKTYKIYAINNNNPTKSSQGSLTTSEECPNCKKRNMFRVYEPKNEYETDENYVAIYDCKCPNCETEFEIIDEFEKED